MPKANRGKTPFEREMEKMQRAILMKEQALIDYNTMMGNLEDPSEGEEDEVTEI